MVFVRSSLLKVRCRVWQRQLPKIITLTDYDPGGVRFEAIGATELRRIVNRGYEEEYLGRMLDALDRRDVLYDIGANIGLVALHAASRCRAVAFEPDPGFYGRLERNLELNPSAAIELLPIAISDSDGTVNLYTDGCEGTSPSLVRQRSERGTVVVQSYALDSIVERRELPAPTVLKLDIEGAEMLALQGAARLLHGEAPPRLLFLEVHDGFLPAFGSSAEEVLALVHGAGYQDVMYEATRADQRHLILGHTSR